MSAAERISENWKHPDELIKLHRLKQKKKKLAARLSQSTREHAATPPKRQQLLEAKITEKRINPFAKCTNDVSRRRLDSTCDSTTHIIKENSTDNTPAALPEPYKFVLKTFDAKAFSELLQKKSITSDEQREGHEDEKHTKHLPIDWSIKTRMRFFCRSELPATTLKTNQAASGMTSFVRCIDRQNCCSNLDISPATRFSQATYYWQQPHLPWLTLYPRNAKENIGVTVGERERNALAEDWDSSFRGLFHLLRARQCPYFYVCANTFTVLFRAAGTAGRVETHALMSPTTRGLRTALRQEGIEYTMPLKKNAELNKSDDGKSVSESNGPFELEANQDPNAISSADDEEEEDQWLESLGVDDKEIRRIKSTHNRKIKAKEMVDDFSDNSLVLVEGVECQGFFSFLLNAKSAISTVGRLAGVPPTLLAPVAFPKATMQQLTTRSNMVRMDSTDYCSIECKGIILPSFLPYVCDLFGESKDTFSVTLATNNVTLAFSKATKILLEGVPQVDEQQERRGDEMTGQVFGQENLSDCGLPSNTVESICRTGQDAVALMERVCYDRENGYAWC